MWKIIIFLFGTIVGYVIGYYKIHLFLSLQQKVLSMFMDFSPEISFLSDVAAFEGVILAILIPLSTDIVSKISERYNSEIIVNTFESPLWNRSLPIVLLINIILAIILRFSMQQDETGIVFRILAWIILMSLFYIACVVYFVIQRIKNFIKNPKNVIDQLIKQAEASFES